MVIEYDGFNLDRADGLKPNRINNARLISGRKWSVSLCEMTNLVFNNPDGGWYNVGVSKELKRLNTGKPIKMNRYNKILNGRD